MTDCPHDIIRIDRSKTLLRYHGATEADTRCIDCGKFTGLISISDDDIRRLARMLKSGDET